MIMIREVKFVWILIVRKTIRIILNIQRLKSTNACGTDSFL